MKTKHNELAIGITVTIATLLVVMTILLLGKSSVITVGMRLELKVQDANGLGAGDNVTYRGIDVGTVEGVQLQKSGVLAVLKLRGNPDIPVDSQFVIKEASLLGGRSVEIQPGTSRQMLKPDAVVTGHSRAGILSIAEGSSGVKNQVSQILSNIDTLSGQRTVKGIYSTLQGLENLTRTLQAVVDENRSAVAATVANLKQASSSADETVGNLNQITAQNERPIRKTIASLSETTAQLQEVLKETSVAVNRLNAMLTALQHGQGSLGKLMVDDSLYREMKTTVAEIDALVKDIRKNPKKYVTVKIF